MESAVEICPAGQADRQLAARLSVLYRAGRLKHDYKACVVCRGAGMTYRLMEMNHQRYCTPSVCKTCGGKGKLKVQLLDGKEIKREKEVLNVEAG